MYLSLPIIHSSFKSIIRIFLIAGVLFIFSDCKKSTAPETRSFYMGVTPWPSDFTVDAVGRAYSFINTHCDIVSHHFDDGVPYEEATKGLAMPLKLQNEVNSRILKTAAGQHIFLSVAPLSLSRTGKAVRLSDTANVAIDNYWNSLTMSDSMMVKAYINYVGYLVDAFHPIFINYGVESNSQNWDPVAFAQYKVFLSRVYTSLKLKYPAIPLFISFMVGEDPGLLSNAAQLTNATDIIGLSAYPYTNVSSSANGNTNPALFPADYFTKFINLDASKPFGFAETGYIAQDLNVSSYNLHKTGTVQWQADYLDTIANLCNRQHAKFLIWFCAYDYDAGNRSLQQLGLYQDLFAFWQDTGFYDENYVARPSFTTWNNWMSRVRK